MELLSILEDLQHIEISENINVSNHIQGYFSSDTVFGLSKKVLSETEMKVIAKALDFAPIQNNINGPKLRKDLEKVCRRMRIICTLVMTSHYSLVKYLHLHLSSNGSHLKVIQT